MHQETITLPRVFVTALLTVAWVACHAPRPETGDGSTATTLLVPGSPLLMPPRLNDSTARMMALITRVTDTAEHRLSETVREQRPVAGHEGQVLLISTWSPPTASHDTISVARRSLAPINEHLEYRGSFQYQYSHNHVSGTVQRQDSAAQSFDQSYPQDVFAFAEVDLLVRSLPFTRGLNVVVPLFSESDADLEMDTITVVGPDSAASQAGGWVVRFADPVITTRYVVSRSRQILSNEVTQRRSATHIRFVPAS